MKEAHKINFEAVAVRLRDYGWSERMGDDTYPELRSPDGAVSLVIDSNGCFVINMPDLMASERRINLTISRGYGYGTVVKLARQMSLLSEVAWPMGHSGSRRTEV